MGISPGVLIANLHLLYYEFAFRQRLVNIVLANHNWRYSRDPQVRARAQQLLAPDATPHSILAGAEYWADAAMLVLEAFQYFGRYIDDVGSGPNRYFLRLQKATDSILHGLITGIYPPSLRLDPTHDPASQGYIFQILDVELRLRQVPAPAGQPGPIVSGDVFLCDEQSNPKYAHLKMLRYHHVFFAACLAMQLWCYLWPAQQIYDSYYFA